jgi:phage terminase large subunit-like protein
MAIWPRTGGNPYSGPNLCTIVLNHTIVPARDKKASARFFAQLSFPKILSGPDFSDKVTRFYANQAQFESGSVHFPQAPLG